MWDPYSAHRGIPFLSQLTQATLTLKIRSIQIEVMTQRGYNGSRLGARVFDPPLRLAIFYAVALHPSSHDRRLSRIKDRMRDARLRPRSSVATNDRRMPRRPKASSASGISR